MRKIITALLLVFSSPVFANGFQGLYLDIGVGGKHDSGDNFVGRNANGSTFRVPDMEVTHLSGQIKVGYGIDISSRTNLGANIFYDIGNSKDSTDFQGSHITYEYTNTFGLSFEPGFYINENLLIYGKLGYVRSDFKGINETFNITFPTKVNGPLYGFGAKYLINKSVYIGAEITKYDYGSSSGVDTLNRPVHFNGEQGAGLISIGYTAN